MKYDFNAVNLPKLIQVTEGPNDVCATCDSDGKAHIHSNTNWIHMEKEEAERLARFLYGTYIDDEVLSTPEPTPDRTFGVIMTVIFTSICGGLALGLTIGHIL